MSLSHDGQGLKTLDNTSEVRISQSSNLQKTKPKKQTNKKQNSNQQLKVFRVYMSGDMKCMNGIGPSYGFKTHTNS